MWLLAGRLLWGCQHQRVPQAVWEALEQRERPRKWSKLKEKLRTDGKSGKELISNAGAQLCKMQRGVSLKMPLLCQLVSCCFTLPFPPRLSSAARGGGFGHKESEAAGEGRGWLVPLAYRAPIPGIFGAELPHQRMPSVIVTPQTPSPSKRTWRRFDITRVPTLRGNKTAQLSSQG